MNTKRGKLRVGTSGYQYNHWCEVFYPNALPKKDWFMYYATHFDTGEINNTFYRLPSAETFAEWRGRAPRGFCYALKFSRYGSHRKRLKEPQELVHTFLDRAAHLKDHLGPILVQLPPRWLCEAVFSILRQYHAALCLHDLIVNHPRLLTADWVYLRFHGGTHGGNYPPQTLSAQARRIRQYLVEGKDVFVYFNNDARGRAVQNAAALQPMIVTPSSFRA